MKKKKEKSFDIFTPDDMAPLQQSSTLNVGGKGNPVKNPSDWSFKCRLDKGEKEATRKLGNSVWRKKTQGKGGGKKQRKKRLSDIKIRRASRGLCYALS